MDPHLSFWQRSVGEQPGRRRLEGDVDADVCIVGAGYTGLWTAWGLLRSQPDLKVAIVEARRAGYGASGRNGGWLSGILPGDRSVLARGRGGETGVRNLQRHLIDSVYRVAKVCVDEGIEADVHLGGTLAVATNSSQIARLREEVAEDRRWGLHEGDQVEVDRSAVLEKITMPQAVGAVFSPHCARIHPAKMVTGLAKAVERRGAVIYELSPVLEMQPGLVRTAAGRVKTKWIVRATEGYTAALPGLRRKLLPLNSSMLVTSPLNDATWSRIGWTGGETVRDGAHAYVYMQRTADNRIAIGGRGVPYRFGSRLAHTGEIPPSTVRALRDRLRDLLPALDKSVAIDGSWSGVLGVARDWCPTVSVDRHGDGGTAWAGGYVGDGVTTSHLAGLTLADLILERDTELTGLPWVDHHSRSWEPEPLRWIGVRAVYGLYRAADVAEARRPRRAGDSRLTVVADRVAGRR